jgi:hypothetical protein
MNVGDHNEVDAVNQGRKITEEASPSCAGFPTISRELKRGGHSEHQLTSERSE